jgi:deazaflavin-dependent nitroreductase family protein
MADQHTTTRTLTKIGRRMQHLFTQVHTSLYRLTEGKVGGGEHLLILTTVGRKSGQKRSTPLFFFHDEGNFVVIASNGGSKTHPTWWLNLKSHPQATVQIGAQVIPVTAHQTEGEERERLWSIIADNYQQFVRYQQRTARPLPIISLAPIQ